MACCESEWPASGCCCDRPDRSCTGPVLPEVEPPVLPEEWAASPCCGGAGGVDPAVVLGPETCVSVGGETTTAFPSNDGWWQVTSLGLAQIAAPVTVLDDCDPRCAPVLCGECGDTPPPAPCCVTTCEEGALAQTYSDLGLVLN